MYELAHVVPLPLHQTKFLIVPNYILYDQNGQILPFEKKWPKIHQTYICENTLAETNLVNIHCLKGILYEQTATCDIKDIGQQEIIKEVEQRHIFIFNTVKTNISSSCREPFSISGNGVRAQHAIIH